MNQMSSAEEFFKRLAPDDVRNAVRWLLANGYELTSQNGDSEFGAQFVFVGEAEVHITVERSQWFLDVAPEPGLEPLQFDVLVAAQRGQAYEECFPPPETSRALFTSLPPQLPEGLSWHDTLPEVLRWVDDADIAGPVARAEDQRCVLMWPDSPKAQRVRRNRGAQNRQEDD